MQAIAPQADVTLLFEATYPYVPGGVANWAHWLIQGLPEVRFAVIFIGSRPEDYGEMRYRLPDNVVHIQCAYLYDPMPIESPLSRTGDEPASIEVARLHRSLRNAKEEGLDKTVLERVLRHAAHEPEVTTGDFYYSRAAWEHICSSYGFSEEPFINYFWAVRNAHTPLFKVIRIVASIPPSRVVHAISTGYAGLLGAMLRARQKSAFILTEHGIYTIERKIDLMNAFLREGADAPSLSESSRQIWVRWFEGLGRITYTAADVVTSLYEKNRLRQIADGAEAGVTRVIPNGIDIERFAPLRAKRPQRVPPVFGLIGRIVPIKDCRTFIRAMRIIVSELPAAQGWLVGPEEENPKYVEECKQLARSLGLERHVSFLGYRNVEEILPQLGLLMLTSISEAFPLALVEAFASGLPVVATDVGACRNIIEGNGPEDRLLGTAGAVVPIANPEATASAALALVNDGERWRAAQSAGIHRVERYYSQSKILAQYRQMYCDAGAMQ
jgi:glycosyltransferase involved in cell wall biosynthesis